MKLGITEYIDCAHFLPGHEKCGRLHGHTYKVEIVIEGDHKKGMIIDFADLKKADREVLAANTITATGTTSSSSRRSRTSASCSRASSRSGSRFPSSCGSGKAPGSGPRRPPSVDLTHIDIDYDLTGIVQLPSLSSARNSVDRSDTQPLA